MRIRGSRLLKLMRQWWEVKRYYETDVNPLRYLWTDPDNIYQTNKNIINKSDWDIGHVIGGRWDREQRLFEDTAFLHHPSTDSNIIYQSLNNHFTNGVSWEDTELFHRVLYEDLHWRGVQTKNEFYDWCEHVEDLFVKMRTQGYITYQQRTGNKPKKPEEILVKVGRNGNFFFLDGKHRLSIAKILNLEKVAVNIIVRHKKWQELRDDIYMNGLCDKTEHLKNHPDIQCILTVQSS